MANVTFAHGVASSPLLFLAELEDMAVLAHLTRAGATRAVLVTDTQKFILTGADFTTTRIDGVKTLTGGTLDQVVAIKEGAKLMTVTRLGLDLTDLLDAAMAETTALNTGAVEALLYPPGWTCTGNRAPDNLAVDATSGDGVVINLTGDDLLRTKGGSIETIFPGDGNDSAFGGGSFDVIYGGNGRDILHGDGGHDSLIGGNQGDFLFGEGGDDRFFGGAGDDLIVGGRGADNLAGEQGRDTFVFHFGDTPAFADTIQDFEIGRDVIDLPNTTHAFVFQFGALVLFYGPGVDQGDHSGKDRISLPNLTFDDIALITIV